MKVELGDDSTYAIKGVGSASFQLDSGTIIHIEKILYVPGLKNNLLSMEVLEDKGVQCSLLKRKGPDVA